jgi:hypothetical protein
MMLPQFPFRFRQRLAVLLLTTLVMLSGWAGLVGARTDPFGERVEVKIPRPADPARTEAAARRSIARFDKAALLACGASDQSFAQMQAAVRQSTCWHQAMDGAVQQMGDARLSAWWAAHRS